MKPTVEKFNKWLAAITGEDYYTRSGSNGKPFDKEYEQLDIEALEECFKIYLGSFNLDSVKNGKELHKAFHNFSFSTQTIVGETKLEELQRRDKKVLEFRNELTGYEASNSYVHVKSIDPKFKDYTFCLWHDSWNSQIIIDKESRSEHIRIMWKPLFNAIYDFFSTSESIKKEKLVQLSLF